MDWKKLGKRMLFPPVWLIVILTIFSAAALIIIFIKGLEQTPWAIGIYVISFYSLMVISVFCWKILPGYYKGIKKTVYQNPYANRYFTDVAFKTHVTLYRSLGINLLYVAVNAVSAVVYGTYWFGIFAVYYGIMALMRFALVRYVKRNPIGANRLGELKRARFCSYVLMTINLVLSGVVLMMIFFHRGFEYQGIMIYVMAMYTFYITAAAIVDMVKYRKYKSPIMSVAKMIKLAAALFSMLFLETAMFSQFGAETSPETEELMIMLTGAGISVIVVGMAIYMIYQTSREIKEIRSR